MVRSQRKTISEELGFERYYLWKVQKGYVQLP
jgi:hypothetical protein